jgi:hypothetical protein
MIRTLDIIMIGVLIAGAGYTFKVKHDAEQAVARVESLETRIRLEREAIDILKADWSLLTSPDRLEALIKRHQEELGLEPLSPRQIVTIDKIPQRQPDLLPIDGEGTAPDRRDAEAEVPEEADRTLTGSVAVEPGSEEFQEELPQAMEEAQ